MFRLRPMPGATSAADWRIDMEDLRAAISPKTKLLIINTPLNPVGKMYSREELLALAQIAQEHDLLVLSDEVYEWMTYDGTPHVRLATLPGMWERTITLGSAGKTFLRDGLEDRLGDCAGAAGARGADGAPVDSVCGDNAAAGSGGGSV